MREILFRGKIVDNGEWIEGQLLHFKSSVGRGELAVIVAGCEWNNANEWFNLGKRAKVIPETVGQYTGLTDKNGKKIFEGDIVNFSDSLYYIVFADGCFRICRNGKYSYTLHNLHSAFEIVGNIHDNPELVKGGAE